MNLKLLLVLVFLSTILAAEAHLNISTVYSKFQAGITSSQKFFSKIGQTFSSAKESLRYLTRKARDNALDALQEICSADVNREDREVVDINMFNFVLMTPCQNYTYSLSDPNNFWTSRGFVRNKKTVILLTGWLTEAEKGQLPILECISGAYLCRDDVNFVFLDTAFYMVTFYDWAALNTAKIGIDIGERISALKEIVPSNSIHIVGHSLGAHTAGVAGRTYYTRTGEKIGRITGLDPARPCFNTDGSLKGVASGDADYVDIIHTNPGVLGLAEAVGDADFFPNGLSQIPKGCSSSICAHGRAWEYYAESVHPGNENNFIATRCVSEDHFKSGSCGSNQVPMGFAKKPTNLKGNFYLEVNEAAPFGKNNTKHEIRCSVC